MIKINWVEIPVTDLERAILFYKNVFSINIELGEIESEKHAILKMNGQVGGILHQVDKVQKGISIYFNVDRLNEVIRKVENNGGKILLEKTLIKAYNTNERKVISSTMFDGKMGYYAKIIDSEGNEIGLHSNS